MCGITGFFDFKQSHPSTVLENMTSCMAHRGPDGNGYFSSQTEFGQLALGHRRLSIIEVSEAGAQPMKFNGLTIVFNGEIYNYEEIRTELVGCGRNFISHSDTEVILQAYEHWGKDCLSKFIGMFAFVIYDEKDKSLFIARDRAGVKPLFYYWANEVFLFASELKAFHRHPRFTKEINYNSVAAFMQYGNVPEPNCIFKNCFKLKPGTCITINLSTRKWLTHTYWNVYDTYNKPKQNISLPDAVKETEAILSKAFRYRMVADVPVGVFLSGGYDSTCVTALLQKDLDTRLRTFTIGVNDEKLDEAPFARKIARHLNTDHTELYCSEKEMLGLVDIIPEHYDEPFGDSSAIPTMLVSKLAREEVTVALSADGGDEIFGGYNRYEFLLKYRSKLQSIPGLLRRAMAASMDAVPPDSIPFLNSRYNFHNRYEKLKGIIRDPSPYSIMRSLTEQFTKNDLERLFQKEFQAVDTAYQSHELKEDFYTPLSYMMAVDYQTYMLDDILQKVDRATMSASLEGREPFLDHHIIEWAATLPDELKIRNGVKKFLLREIVHQYVPKELMERPKMGFAVPVKKWLGKELLPYLNEYLNEKDITSQGIFNWKEVQKIKLDFLSGKLEFELKLWYLLMFQMWYKRWM